MLADHIDHVIGVDTHTDSYSAAVVNPTGSVVANRTVPADAFGYKCIHRFALEHAPGRRLWAIEGTGSYGSGLTTSLLEQGEWVTEIDRPARPARPNGAKSDALDAARAAREALGREHLAQPRRRGDREAVRVLLATRHGAVQSRTRAICHLKAFVVNAPEALRTSSASSTPTSCWPAAPVCALAPASQSSIARPSPACAVPPGARSAWRPRPMTWSPSSRSSWSGSRPSCWPSRASA